MGVMKTIEQGDVELATEAFGDPAEAPILLIMGAMASMLWWPEEFCEQLAACGRYVIRYDNRDTGFSTASAPGNPLYTGDDLDEDPVRILDGYGIDGAHIVGMSMGGGIAQTVALRYPERVLSVTAISTSLVGMETKHLPGMTDAYKKHSVLGEQVDWTNREQFVDYIVKDVAAIASTRHPHDKISARQFIEKDVLRARNFATATNHFLVMSSEQSQAPTSDIDVPLLVIHGTADPLFPIEHGKAIADAVAGSRLVPIEGGGHEIHEMDWPQYLDAIISHTGGRQ